MAGDNDCAFCMEPIVTKTRSNTHFVYRCKHMFHTRCAAAYVYESEADVNAKFRCILCRKNQSTWFPARLPFDMAVQCKQNGNPEDPAERMKWEDLATDAFFECVYVNSFRPGKVGFDHNLKMARIPERFDTALCRQNITIALTGMLGKGKFGSKQHFEHAVDEVITAVRYFIEARENHSIVQPRGDYWNAVFTLLFGPR